MPIVDKIEDTKVPVLLWTPLAGIEPGAVQQLRNVANLPVSVRRVAAMPDVHFGYGATVGTVMATRDAVVPSAVGVDIGCGMMAVRTDLDPDAVRGRAVEIKRQIERSVPTGFHWNKEVSDGVKRLPLWEDAPNLLQHVEPKYEDLLGRAKLQIGTLGGGNHFIEVSVDGENRVWVMLHSGSRAVGLKIANHYTAQAKKMMERWHIELPDPYLAYLPRGESLFDCYWDALEWAQRYAWANREEMMRRCLDQLSRLLNGKPNAEQEVERKLVHCHHNYANIENHDGENLIIVRKGATSARAGEMGIIPGSMGAASYITLGKGEAASFCSSSHGAGRKMGRKEAARRFTVDDLKAQMVGIVGRTDAGVLDEIPSAYKDIDVVMAQQTDLVDTVAVLRQVVSVKGGGRDEG